MARPKEPPATEPGNQRSDPRWAAVRDVERMERRRDASRSFWRSLGVLGTVGWSIAIPTVAGALLGRQLDVRLETGVRFTLMLLTAGVCLGGAVAWKLIHGQRD